MPDFRSLANVSVRNLIPYQPGKPIEEVERELGIKSSIKLASNENPLGPSPLALQALQNALPAVHIYPDGFCYDFKHALATYLGVQVEQITVGNGSENILELIAKAYLNHETSAVISQYAFLTIPIILKSYGIKINVAPAVRYSHNVENILTAIDNNTRVIYLVNPNNPTGTYLNRTDFLNLMNAIPNHIVVVVDEAYSEYITKQDYPNALSYLANYPNLIITRTFSKVYGLAALRIGYAIASPEISDILNRSRLPFNVNTLAAKAAAAALNDVEHVKRSVELNSQGLSFMEEALNDLSFDYIPSIGNFITIDVKDAITIYQQLLMEGVIVRPLQAYDMPKHIRVTIGTHEQNIRFLASLEKNRL